MNTKTQEIDGLIILITKRFVNYLYAPSFGT